MIADDPTDRERWVDTVSKVIAQLVRDLQSCKRECSVCHIYWTRMPWTTDATLRPSHNVVRVNSEARACEGAGRGYTCRGSADLGYVAPPGYDLRFRACGRVGPQRGGAQGGDGAHLSVAHGTHRSRWKTRACPLKWVLSCSLHLYTSTFSHIHYRNVHMFSVCDWAHG
jgi:hypothetical protein